MKTLKIIKFVCLYVISIIAICVTAAAFLSGFAWFVGLLEHWIVNNGYKPFLIWAWFLFLLAVIVGFIVYGLVCLGKAVWKKV
jgi:hypothetical protein